MKSNVKLFILGFVVVIVAGILLLKGQIIQNTTPEECAIETIEVVKVHEGGTYDIVFTAKSGETYYINRGLEQGLTIADLNKKVLYKSVTLHLPKVMLGTSTHIAQMQVEDQVIFTEFN